MAHKNPPLSETKQVYWNFWKVVLAGWLIRYPRKFLSIIFWVLFIPLMGVGYILSTELREEPDRVIPSERLNLPPIHRENYEKYVFNLFAR